MSLVGQGILALSDEVLVLVLSFLESHGDLISCSQVSQRFRTLASDQSLVKRLNFRRDISLTREKLRSFFSIPATSTKVLSLNLNGVYWIPPGVLQTQIIKMKNLQELHVGDVQFSAKQFSTMVASLGELRKLSMNWHWETKEEVDEITKLSLASVYRQLVELNIYLATGENCPLDKLTWLLTLCRDLTHISVLSKNLHSQTLSSKFPPPLGGISIYPDLVVFNLPALQSVVWAVSNKTFPSCIIREVKGKLESFISPSKILPDKFIFSRDGPREVSVESLLQPDSPQKNLCLRDEEYPATRIFMQPSQIFRNFTELRVNIGDDLNFLNPEHLRKIEKLHCENPFNCSRKKGKLLNGTKRTLENLENLKYFQSGKWNKPVGGPLLEALASEVPQLESLVLAKVGISPSHNKSLTKLLFSCANLSHLELTDIDCPAQRLLGNLDRGLKAAKRLKTLKILQKDLTQYSPRLLDSLAENCDLIEQVVFVDTSKAFTLKKYPIKKVVKIAQEKKFVQFIYICSELLTKEDDKFLKRSIKKLLVEKPYLLVRLQSKLGEDGPFQTGIPGPFYSLEDVDLPMEFQLSVASLIDQDFSPVANITVDHVF